MTAKHQRSCSTCVWSKTRKLASIENKEISIATTDYNWYKICTNVNGLEYKTHIANYDDITYIRGKSCHTKTGDTMTTSNTDYVEYQKGSVKLRLANQKMTLTVNVQNVAFNSVEKRKIEEDLKDVFEVVTLASDKLPTIKETSSTKGVEL